MSLGQHPLVCISGNLLHIPRHRVARQRLPHLCDEFQAGDYSLKRHQPYSQIIAVMRKGPAVTVDRITIPEGFTLDQIASMIRLGEIIDLKTVAGLALL